MKADKVFIAAVASMVALTVFIGWSFYQVFSVDPARGIKREPGSQKAVMIQAQAMNEARLKALAEGGKVAPGMSQDQVKLAFGEPASVEQLGFDGEQQTVWWYEHETWMSIVFDPEGVVARLEKQP